MGFKNICKKTWTIFTTIVIGLWTVTIILVIVPPALIYYTFKRIYLRRKIIRKLKMENMPSPLARKMAKNYTNFLFQYSSIRGLARLSKITKEQNENIEVNEDFPDFDRRNKILTL